MKTTTPQNVRKRMSWYSITRKRGLQLVLAALFLMTTGGEALAQSARWEYCVRSAKLQNRLLEQMLNDYAAQGWELVQIERGVAVFKRAKR